jgi:hypothetical protein
LSEGESVATDHLVSTFLVVNSSRPGLVPSRALSRSQPAANQQATSSQLAANPQLTGNQWLLRLGPPWSGRPWLTT